MCGIAGVISTSERFVPADEVLRRMGRRIAHRGPDGEGIAAHRTFAGTHAALVHRRLAVLDPDPRSNQPFTAESGGRRVHLVFNGEIYNFRELRQRLEPLLPGFAWRTTGDTEVLAAAYLAWGPACVDVLLGMFAFALVDDVAGTVLLARDRMGQKPLYYSLSPDGEALAFASELPALTELPWLSRDIHEDALRHYLAFGYTPLAGSIYRGVCKLPPACALTFPPAAAPGRYWSDAADAAETPSDPVAALRDLTRAAVTSQLVSDVPLGCFLSGGIDSSVIALCAQRALAAEGRRLRTFTVAFDDPRYDESAHAAEVAARLGTDHTVLRATPDVAADLPLLAAAYGEPFADSSCLPTYYLCREARQHVTVALAGDGGDELFGGYDRYRALDLSCRWQPLARLPGLGAVGRSLSRGHPRSRRARAGRFLAAMGLPAGHRYESWVRLFPPGTWQAPPLTGRVAGEPLPDGVDVVLAAMALDRRTYLDGDLLTKVDRASMRVALEVRAPFMDHRLVATAAHLSRAELFAPDGRVQKSLLHRAFGEGLPEAVFRRPKRGFAVPIGEWFRGPLRHFLHDVLLSTGSFCLSRWGRPAVETLVRQHDTAAHDHSQRLFAAVMLDLWHRETNR